MNINVMILINFIWLQLHEGKMHLGSTRSCIEYV